MTDWTPPRIVTRQEWLARPPTSPIQRRPLDVLRGLVVHHEASQPPLDADPCELVAEIQRFHQVTRGWADIAYNTLVWHDGTVLLGRDAAVRGAHTVAPGSEDWNITHLGVCILGDGFDAAYVTDDAWRAVLWCWQLGMFTTGGKASGFLTHHETGSATVCAGSEVQWRMDTLRQFLGGLAASPPAA